MPKILVAVNGSPESEKALKAAVRLAQQDDRDVAALAVLEGPSDPHLRRLSADILEEARAELHALLQAAVNFARSRGVQLTPLLREGQAADAIITCAEQHGAELLILGGAPSKAERRSLGRTADQVSSLAPCTLMLVK